MKGELKAGVDAEVDDFRDFASQLIAHINTGLAEVEKMHDLTLEDSLARVERFLRHMAKFKRK